MKNNIKNQAVSPVIAVMLMLVVTIIIAAVVSGFAAGLTSDYQRPQSMTFSGKLSVSNGVVLTHTGGDALSTKQINIQMRPGPAFGIVTYAATVVNKTTITNAAGTSAWETWMGGNGGINTWSPGDSAYILPPYQDGTYLQPGQSSSYYFAKTANIGKTVIVELINENGQLFARSEIPILS